MFNNAVIVYSLYLGEEQITGMYRCKFIWTLCGYK